MGELASFIPRHVNGVKIDQRANDGFINGTAMCVAHGKDINDWFRLEKIYELFMFLAQEFGIESNMAFCRDSGTTRLSATKYAEFFPGLIFVKRGSPENGGGVWLHPDIAMQLAQWCSIPFAIQVSRWIREWFATAKNPVQVDLDTEAILWQQRYDVRVYLKDYLRPDLMNAVVGYALKNGMNPIKLCASVHDTMNERVQGMKSKDIKTLNGLPLSDLIRDFFETTPLLAYAAINKLARNRIEDFNVDPVRAVHDACDMYREQCDFVRSDKKSAMPAAGVAIAKNYIQVRGDFIYK